MAARATHADGDKSFEGEALRGEEAPTMSAIGPPCVIAFQHPCIRPRVPPPHMLM